MLTRLYSRIMGLAQHPRASLWLVLVAFIESSVFPIPPDVLLIPMVLADRRKAWRYAGISTLASVAGGFLGYAIGSVFYDTLGQAIVQAYHLEAKAAEYAQLFRDNAIMIMAVKGLVPVIPYKLITITAGLAKMDLLTFAITSLLVRALRFYLVAGLLWKFGEPIRSFIEKRLGLVTAGFAIALVGGFLILKLV